MNMVKPFVPALAAGGIATLVNQLVLEDESSMREMPEVLKYAGIVAACQFAGARVSSMVLPEFSEPHLANLQRIGMSAATTSFLNVVAQRYISRDFRVEHSLATGMVGGGAGVLVGDMFFK